METLLRIGLSNALAAVLLALAVGTAAYIWRRPAVRHALWLLVLLKLVTPPLLWLPEPWSSDQPAPQAVAEAPAETPPNFTLPPDPPPADAPTDPAPADIAILSLPDPAPMVPVPEAHLAPPPATTAPTWMVTILGIWLAGSLAWYALALYRLRSFGRLLRHATPAPEALRQRTQRLAEKLGVRRCPGVWLVPGRVAPMLWAAGGSPRILFPAELLGRVDVEQQNALLVHELAHLRRRDHWVRWLEFAAAGLYWWHPVLWLTRRELREAEEQCCDAWVTSTLPGAGKVYATALLETLAFLSDAPPAAPLLATGVGRVSDLKRRLTMIMRGTTPKALGWRGGLTVAGLGVLLLSLLPAWAQAQVQVKPEPKEGGDGLRFVFVADGDYINLQTELKALEAQLQQKQAEAAALAARMEMIKAQFKARQAALAPNPAPPEPAPKVDPGFVVRIPAGEASPAALKDLLKRLQTQAGGAAPPEVIVLEEGTGKIILKMAGPNPAPPAGAADTDKRIDDLETKLKSILEEVEKMRHERKPDAPAPPGGVRPEAGAEAPVPNKAPYLDRFFVNFTTRVREQDLPAMKERVEAVAARSAALAAALQDAKAKITDTAHRRDLEVAQAKAEVDKAQATLQLAEKALREASTLAKSGGVSQGDLNKAEADAAVQLANVQKAQAQLELAGLDYQTRLRDLDKQAAQVSEELKSSEDSLRQLQEEMAKPKGAPGGDPAKP